MEAEESAYRWGKTHGHKMELITVIKTEEGLTHLQNAGTHRNGTGGTVRPNREFKGKKLNK